MTNVGVRTVMTLCVVAQEMMRFMDGMEMIFLMEKLATTNFMEILAMM